MAEKKENPVVDNETGKIKVKSKKEQQPTNNKTEGNVTKVQEKMKMKPKDLSQETITKVDLNKPIKPEENEVKEDNVNDSGVVAESENANATQEQEKVQSEAKTQKAEVLEEVDEKVNKVISDVKETILKSEETGDPLPENIEKLVKFMDETGGDIHDYVKLNIDYSEMENQDLLYEYYKQTKPHLNNEEINFLMEDQFSYDEESDDEKEIRRKKLAQKEQVASAKAHLEENKSKYYDEIKAGSKLTEDQQKAIDFFNRYTKESKESQEVADKQKSTFLNKTENVFNNDFKGFEYSVGDKVYRFNVSNAEEIKKTQSDINNFVKKFLNENNEISDAEGYHKSLYTAMNADAIAKHFYEQGKSDAMQDSITNAKNVDMNPRQSHGEVNVGGVKVRVLGEDSNDFKFKIKNKNK
jgi:hypothetical protein